MALKCYFLVVFQILRKLRSKDFDFGNHLGMEFGVYNRVGLAY